MEVQVFLVQKGILQLGGRGQVFWTFNHESEVSWFNKAVVLLDYSEGQNRLETSLLFYRGTFMSFRIDSLHVEISPQLKSMK